jgi:hypothetical protein
MFSSNYLLVKKSLKQTLKQLMEKALNLNSNENVLFVSNF